MFTATRIAEIHEEAITFGAGKLPGKDSRFLESIYEISQRPGFAGLSSKQGAWFNTIARKLEATKGKYGFQVVAERTRQRYYGHSEGYYIACAGR